MIRRHIIPAILLLLTFPIASFAADDHVDYTPAAYSAAIDNGQPLLVDFYASWCGTCRAQQRTIASLQSENAAYKNVTVMRVDWDKYGRSDFAKSLKIPRRSTLVMFTGGKEVGRVVAQTGSSEIEALYKLVM